MLAAACLGDQKGTGRWAQAGVGPVLTAEMTSVQDLRRRISWEAGSPGHHSSTWTVLLASCSVSWRCHHHGWSNSWVARMFRKTFLQGETSRGDGTGGSSFWCEQSVCPHPAHSISALM